jgi:hypothetical protein
MLGQLDGIWSVGELVHLWQRGVRENNLCGCGRRFRDCPFWRRVGEGAASARRRSAAGTPHLGPEPA